MQALYRLREEPHSRWSWTKTSPRAAQMKWLLTSIFRSNYLGALLTNISKNPSFWKRDGF